MTEHTGRLTPAVAFACAVALVAPFALAGDTNPPAGPITPTMKTLDEVEPRIAINATNTPGDINATYVIGSPGSYYLTGNVTGEAAKHGIKILSTDVTIDLMGFRLLGIAGSLDGIQSSSNPNITIRNGTVRFWGQDGIDLGTGTDSANILVEDIHAHLNGGSGIIAGASSVVVRACTATENLSDGIAAFLGVIVDCSSCFNQGIGFYFGAGSAVSNCMARENAGGGYVSVGFGSTISNCHADNNTAYGFDAAMGTTIIHCTARGNLRYGIRASSECLILENNCADNGDSSNPNILITGADNRIEGNTITKNTTGVGLHVAGSGNLVIRNSASGNSTNFAFSPGNTLGPIITGPGTITSDSPHANYDF